MVEGGWPHVGITMFVLLRSLLFVSRRSCRDRAAKLASLARIIFVAALHRYGIGAIQFDSHSYGYKNAGKVDSYTSQFPGTPGIFVTIAGKSRVGRFHSLVPTLWVCP